jgi:hypothetical protein
MLGDGPTRAEIEVQLGGLEFLYQPQNEFSAYSRPIRSRLAAT